MTVRWLLCLVAIVFCTLAGCASPGASSAEVATQRRMETCRVALLTASKGWLSGPEAEDLFVNASGSEAICRVTAIGGSDDEPVVTEYLVMLPAGERTRVYHVERGRPETWPVAASGVARSRAQGAEQ